MQDIFGDDEPISTYTDAQALDDGVLVSLGLTAAPQFHGDPVNRITRTLLTAMLPYLIDPKNPMGPTITDPEEMTRGHLIDLRRVIQAKLKYARDTADAKSERGVHFALPIDIWMVANETGGFTLMFPEDY